MKAYFQFNKSQKTGVIVLSIICVILIYFLNKPINGVFPEVFITDTSELSYFYLRKDSFPKKENSIKNNNERELKPFNPNLNSVQDWEELGFSNKQAQSIVNFKEKIGGFKSKEDIKQVYVISKSKYADLAPYFVFEKKQNAIPVKFIETKIKLDLNSATIEELIMVKGIGNVLSKRIIEYKKLLGGFHELNQLKEVYGLSEDNFILMSASLKVDTAKIHKIKLSSTSFSQLKAHPYISWTLAEKLLSAIKKDSIIKRDSIFTLPFLSDSNKKRLIHYLDI